MVRDFQARPQLVEKAAELPAIDDNLFCIHYGCEPLDLAKAASRTPRVFAVALRHCRTGDGLLLSAHLAAERQGQMLTADYPLQIEAEVLSELDNHLQKRAGAVFLHFNMNGSKFGFEALDQRSRLARGGPLHLPSLSQRFDLSAWLKQRLEREFVKHPYLHSLIQINGLTRRDYLDPAKERAAWDAGDWGAVALTAEARAALVSDLYCLLLKDSLLTALGRVGPLGKVRPRPDLIIALGKKFYAIGDYEPQEVTDSEDCLLQAFLTTPAMSLCTLANRSGLHESTGITLRRLRKKYGGRFAPAIDMPLPHSKTGYRVRITQATPSRAVP
jgi:hypothetical protein